MEEEKNQQQFQSLMGAGMKLLGWDNHAEPYKWYAVLTGNGQLFEFYTNSFEVYEAVGVGEEAIRSRGKPITLLQLREIARNLEGDRND